MAAIMKNQLLQNMRTQYKNHVDFVDTKCGHSCMPFLIFFVSVTFVDRFVEKEGAHIALMALILTAI